MALDWWYHGQFRAYIVQVIRAFSGFQVATAFDPQGNPTALRTVPVKMAAQDRLVASILNNNSENTILSTPSISVWLTNIDIPPERRQIPNHVDTLNVVEREVDRVANRYTTERGMSYTVERFMPVAYDLTFQVDIWTSNLDQKCQILEQILTLFNPGVDIQTSTNAIDWTALTTMTLESVNWDSRTIPIGTSTELSISTITLKVPAWISPPAKVQRQRIIEQIITQISQLDPSEVESNKDVDSAKLNWASQGDLFARSIVTPNDHMIRLEGNVIQLLNSDRTPLDNTEEPWNWLTLFELYGKYRPGISQIRLKTVEDIEDWDTDIVGSINVDPNNPEFLTITFDPQTLPENNLPAIDAIIDPHKSWFVPAGDPPCPNPLPLAQPTVGLRYLITNDIIANTTWGPFFANANDIIEFGSDMQWHVVFNSSIITDTYTLLNNKSGKQIRWENGVWQNAIAEYYRPGYWRIAL